MLNKILYILLCFLIPHIAFGQKDTTVTHKSKFYIGMAVNNIIPTVQSYQLDEESVFPEGSVSAQIFPKATVSLSINSGYDFYLFSVHKFNIADRKSVV